MLLVDGLINISRFVAVACISLHSQPAYRSESLGRFLDCNLLMSPALAEARILGLDTLPVRPTEMNESSIWPH